MRALIGKADGRDTALDVDVLLRTRLLVQANSGGGKSWLLRRLAEQLFGQVQVIIIDPEGEFATLRERYGYVLVGKGGETPADTRSAALVAHKLLELNACAVCDIFEMKPADRHRWVRLFLEALIDAPKRLWHPAVVIVDEAHVFAPEKGAGDSEASDAMIGLATRGRKRGFAAVLATQRLGKLRKDVAAECANVLVGQTFMDIDRERAAHCLGISGKGALQAFYEEIRLLTPGRFYGLGRAIADQQVLITVGTVQTSHPEPGSSKHAAAAPPAPKAVKALLPQLADLPQEAEAEARTVAELKAEVGRLKRELAAAEKAPPAAERVEVPVLKGEELDRAEKLVDRLQASAHEGRDAAHLIEKAVEAVFAEYGLLRATIAKATAPQRGSHLAPAPRQSAATPARAPRQSASTVAPATNGSSAPLAGGERKILTVLAQYPEGRTKTQVAILTGYASSGGGFNNYLSALRSRGYIEGAGLLQITDAGLSALGAYEPMPTGKALRDYWMARLSKAERSALAVLATVHPGSLSKDDVANSAGYEASGGGFNNALSKLRTLELITGRGELRAADELFD